MDKLKRVLSPGSKKDDSAMYEGQSGTSSTAPTTSSSGAPQIEQKSMADNDQSMLKSVLNPGVAKDESDNASIMAIKHGHTGPYAEQSAETPITGSSPQATETGGERSFPLGGGQTSTPSYPDPTTASRSANSETTQPPLVEQPETAPATDISSYDGSSAPPFSGTSQAEPNLFTKGPHITDTANRLDPHIPGEFPSDDGLDAHDSSHTGAGFESAAPTSGYGASELPSSKNGLDYPSASEAAPSSNSAMPSSGAPMASDPSSQRDYSRDAAMAGGAGAFGADAYALGKDRSEPPTTRSMQPSSGVYPSSSAVEEPMSQSSTRNPYGSGAATGSSLPSSTDNRPTSSMYSQPTGTTAEEPRDERHYGRDAALAGGAGAAGYGAYKLADRDESGPAQSAGGSLGSGTGNTLDSRAQQDPSLQSRQPTTKPTGTSVPHASYPIDEPQSDHHYGRDAALAGGAGAAGYGAYEYGQDRGVDTGPASKTIGPHESNVANIIDPRVKPDPALQKSHETEQPIQSKPEEEHHYGRNAALAGGAGAAGYGAYNYRTADPDPASNADRPYEANTANLTDRSVQPDSSLNTTNTTAVPGRNAPATSEAYPPTNAEKEQDDHYGRDAAIIGGTGAAAGAAGYGAKEYYDDKAHDDAVAHDAKLEKERAKQAEKAEKAHEKEQHKHDKEAEKFAKEEKKHAKEAVKDQKAHEKEEKAHDKEDKKHAALVAASEKEEQKQAKEVEKEEALRQHEEEKRKYYERHEREKQEKAEEKEKHPSLLHKILHPGHHHGKEDEKADDDDNSHAGAYTAAGASAGAVGAGTYAATRDSDSEPKHSESQSSAPQHLRQSEDDGVGFDNQPGHYRDGGKHHGVQTATDEKGHNKLHKEPPREVYERMQREKAEGTLLQAGGEHGTQGGPEGGAHA